MSDLRRIDITCPIGDKASFPHWNLLMDIYRHGTKNNLLEDIIVHGSFGDYTACSFSDLEITLVATERYSHMKSSRSSVFTMLHAKVTRLIIAVDPLQHHGPFILEPHHRECYTENMLPPVAYSQAWSLAGSSIEIMMKEDSQLLMKLGRSRLNPTAIDLANYNRRFFQYGRNKYSQKRLLSNIFMLPIYLANATGHRPSKRAAISNPVIELPSSIVNLLQSASAIRCNWPQSPEWYRTIRSLAVKQRIPNGKLDYLATNAFRNRSVQHQIDLDVLPLLRSVANDIEQLSDESS